MTATQALQWLLHLAQRLCTVHFLEGIDRISVGHNLNETCRLLAECCCCLLSALTDGRGDEIVRVCNARVTCKHEV